MESLTVESIQRYIDKVINDGNSKCIQDLSAKGYRLQQITKKRDWRSLLEFGKKKSHESADFDQGVPFFFGLGLYHLDSARIEPVCGVATFYMAYSTWDGRILFIDRLEFPDQQEEKTQKLMLQPLAKIAVKLGCARLSWRQIDIPSWYAFDPLPPEVLNGWSTLRMDLSAMMKYTGASDNAVQVTNAPLTRTVVHRTVTECLTTINASPDASFQFRLATGDDVDAITRLVKGLAEFEKEPDAVNISTDNYLRDGASHEPLFYCLLLEEAASESGSTPYSCGMAFVYFGYELGRGRFMYLEDLFLEEAYRKKGGGSLTMRSLAHLCLSLNCDQLYWVALDWNTPALNLYKKIGAKVQQGVLTVRYAGETLKSFAANG